MDKFTKQQRAEALAPILAVLESVLGAAYGDSTNSRFAFLATCKALYESPRLWGTELVVRPGHPFQEGWLGERKTIVGVQFPYSREPGAPGPYRKAVPISRQDLAFLAGSAVQRLDIKASFGLWETPWLWDALAGLPVRQLVAKNYQGSLRGIREALPCLQTLKCHAISDTNLSCLRGLRLTHLGARGSARLTTLTGIKGMPLVLLNVSYCHNLQDLSALEGMKLAKLDLSACEALRPPDVAVLARIPLVRLTCSSRENKVYKVVLPSLGATIRHLDLGFGSVKDEDLLAIRGLPLETLRLSDCSGITHIGVAHLAPMSATLKLLDLRCVGESKYRGGIKISQCPEQLRPVIRI
jgi:hypothetical protein